MPVRAEEQKNEAVEAVAALATRQLGDGRAAAIAGFVRGFYSHVPPEDILARAPEDLCGAALSLWQFAETRQAGRAKLRVVDPRAGEEGWRAPRIVVEIVNDDMPFLVDSVTAALVGEGFSVHLVIHPVLRVARDAAGRLTTLLDDAAANGEAMRESFMHVEISADSAGARLDTIAPALERVLGDVRAAVADWPAMRDAAAAGDRATSPRSRRRSPRPSARKPPISSPGSMTTISPFSDIANTALAAATAASTSCPAAASASCATTPIRSSTACAISATLPPDVRQFLREPRLLLITKSNRRATRASSGPHGHDRHQALRCRRPGDRRAAVRRPVHLARLQPQPARDPAAAPQGRAHARARRLRPGEP